MGIGITSASGPPCAKKVESTGPDRSVWKFEWTASGSKPAAARLGFQTGIQPPLIAIARPLATVPSAAAVSPGKLRFTTSIAVRRMYTARTSQSLRPSGTPPPASAASRPNRPAAASNRTGSHRSRMPSRLSTDPPAAIPRTSPNRTPNAGTTAG